MTFSADYDGVPEAPKALQPNTVSHANVISARFIYGTDAAMLSGKAAAA